MKTIRTLVLFGATVAAAGCATNSEQEINYAARLYYYSRLCAESGMLDRETAAKGMAIASSTIYSGESSRLQARAKQMWDAGERPTQSKCNDAQLHIMAAEANRNVKRHAPAPSYSLPRQTHCTTYFGQTHCTTY